jgi:DNA-binding LytR/AlgR family response regulator
MSLTTINHKGVKILRIAIVEDEVQMQALLKQYILKYFESREEKCRISIFSDGEEILDSYTADYDVIFLDIQMEFMNGMKAAEAIRRLDENVYLIFVTNLSNYAIKGYAVNALDFVLKPVNYYILQHLMERVEKLLANREKKASFCLRTAAWPGSTYRKSTISRRKVLNVYTETGVYHIRETMKNMETTLANDHFFHCNSCYLINLAYVSQIKRNIVVIAGHELAISRPRHKAFLEALTEYVGGN